MKLKIKLTSKSAILPRRMTSSSSGLDLHAAASLIVPPSKIVKGQFVEIGRATVKTGLIIQLPKNSIGKIGTRSGLSINRNIEVGAGWIDPDFRGEILIELKNMSATPFKISRGDRIAQLFVIPAVKILVEKSTSLSSTKRGMKGFGSTGLSKKRL